MSNIHENGHFGGLSTEPTPETRDLPACYFIQALQHFRELEGKELTLVGIATPEIPNSIAEVTIFVAPSQDIRATQHNLDEFLGRATDRLLTLQTVQPAHHLHRADERIPEELRQWVQEDSLHTPALIFDDQLRDRQGQLLVQDSTLLHNLGLANCERIITTFSLFPTQRLASLAQRSLPLLSSCRNIYIDNRPVYKVFKYLVSRVIQARNARQINHDTFKIVDAVEYLRDMGIPLTEDEALRAVA